MSLAKKLGIVILLYVILGTAWTLVKLWNYGYYYFPADNVFYRAFDLFFLPIMILLMFILPPPPVHY